MKFNITKGKQKRAVRICMYAVEGCGKTTWASQFPDALFIDTEEGSYQLDVARFPKPESWHELLQMVDAVADGEIKCGTLVIDTIDRAEELLIKSMLEESGKTSIEDYGYGKGYTMLLEKFTKELLYRLDRVITAGVNVVLIAHAAMRKVESPDEPPYDHWEMSLSRKIAPKVKEWTDILLFANYRIMVVEENGRNKARGKARRMMYANHHPTYDAKNRFGLPDEMELGIEPLLPIIEGQVERKPIHNTFNLDAPVDGVVEEPSLEDAYEAFRRHLKEQKITEESVVKYLAESGRYPQLSSLYELSESYVNTLDANIATLVKQIEGGK